MFDRVQTLVAALQRAFSDRSGNVGVTFGMLSVPALMCAGGAVDYHMANQLKTAMQQATDAAILSAMSARTMSSADRAKQAEAMFASNVSSVPLAAKIKPTVAIDSESGSITAKIDMPTSLLRVVGITTLPVQAQSKARPYGRKIEMALMTDITGSMAESAGSTSKIDGLKLAAKDLLDIVLPDDGPNDFARVALIPFANYVNAGPLAPTVTGMDPTHSSSNVVEKLVTCVTERSSNERSTDAAPANSDWIGRYSQGRSVATYSADGNCYRTGSASSLLPPVKGLTNDKASLLSVVDAFTPAGATAGHLGTAWAWYAISPKWNGIWGLADPIAAYSDNKVMKVAVLMTDGEYNTQYTSKGSVEQALALCTGMKAAGITVYTVGFGMSTSNATDIAAMATLSKCASSKDTFFTAYDGEALREVFKQIGGQVANQTAVLTD